MHYIKDIFENIESKHAHDKFVRYSRGKFVGPLMKIKIASSGIKISGSFHFVDELLILLADYLGNKVVHMKGSLVWNQDLTPKLANLGIMYSKVSKSRGIFKYTLENEINIKDFVDNMIDYNILVNIKEKDSSLVTKNAFPKPNKEFTADFCKASFPISFKNRILEEFAFDIEDKNSIKDIIITHEIIINDLEIPQIDNFEDARRLAKRKGTIKRITKVNSNEEVIKTIDICV